MALPVVAVVGRPNVGKSTFFNRVLGRRIAIVDDTPGVTRDRNFGRADWSGRAFMVVDTGGVVEGSDREIDRLIREQAMIAIQEADAVIFLVDSRTGIHSLDERLTEVLRRSARPVLLAANKADNLPDETAHLDFWALGMGVPHPVSAMSGRGFGDLLDALLPHLPAEDEEIRPDDIRVAVIGKPNAGKSTLVNRLFGEERMVVSAEPGTTRDPVDLSLNYHGRRLTFVDTAGLRRHARIQDSVEYYSRLRTERVVRSADVCLVVVDAAQGLHVQDLKVAEAAWEAGCGVVIMCNKWDLVDKETGTAEDLRRQAVNRVPFLAHIPFLFASALTGLRARRTLDLVLAVHERRNFRIATARVNEALAEIVGHLPPPHSRGRPVRIRYATQAQTRPPTFVLFANLPDAVPTHYRRYIVNSLRKRWDFTGVPIRIRLRKGTREP